LRIVILMGMGLALVATAMASAPQTASQPTLDCEAKPMPALGLACLRPDGFFDVVLADGTRLRTHGPDPIPAGGDVGFASDQEQRELVCADRDRLHVLYGHPSGAPDRSAQVIEDLRAAVRRMNAVLNADSLESGGPTADYRVACDDGGQIRVDTFVGPAQGSAAYTAEYAGIVDAARAAGHRNEATDYLIFFDSDSTVCGVGNLASDDSPGASNRNMADIGYGIAYEPCWFGRTPMHENGHNQGAVQDLAPMWDASGHCIEGRDVMCYPGEPGVTGTATFGLVLQCSDRIHFDCGFDTYFDAAPEPGEWLATHWNIGSPVNRYLAFNHTAPVAAPPAGAEAVNSTAPSSSTTQTAGPPSSTSSSSTTRSPSSTSSSTTRQQAVADARSNTTVPSGSALQEPVEITVPSFPPWGVALVGIGLARVFRGKQVR
jgi:hypothetical protein